MIHLAYLIIMTNVKVDMSIKFNSPIVDGIPMLYHGDSKHGCYELAVFVNGQMPQNTEISNDLIKRINEHQGAILVDGGANYFKEILDANPNKIITAPFCCVGDFDSINKATLRNLKREFPEMKTYKFIPNKDFTDLEGALKLIDISKVAVTLFNALGGRVDQMLGNLLYLFRSDYQENVQIFSPKGVMAVFSDPKDRKDWITLPLYEDHTGGLLYVEKSENFSPIEFPNAGIHEYSFDPNHIIEDLKLILHCIKHPIELKIKTQNELFFVIPSEKQFLLNNVKGRTISLIPLGGPVSGVTTRGFQWEINNRILTKDFMSMSNIAIIDEVSISVEHGNLLCVINN